VREILGFFDYKEHVCLMINNERTRFVTTVARWISDNFALRLVLLSHRLKFDQRVYEADEDNYERHFTDNERKRKRWRGATNRAK